MAALNADALSDRLRETYPRVEVAAEVGSTNDELLSGDGPHRSVLFAEHQSAGKGRQGRQWLAPAGSQVAFSVLLRPTVQERDFLGLLPLAAGLAVTDAIEGTTLKWPNDVLVDGERKLAGILSEVADLERDPRVVVGVGINVAQERSELPVEHATSLHAEGRDADRTELAGDVLEALAKRLEQLGTPDGRRSLINAYRQRCATLGQEVVVAAPGGEVRGIAADIAPGGELLLERHTGGRQEVSAGDVTHVRRASGETWQ